MKKNKKIESLYNYNNESRYILFRCDYNENGLLIHLEEIKEMDPNYIDNIDPYCVIK